MENHRGYFLLNSILKDKITGQIVILKLSICTR